MSIFEEYLGPVYYSYHPISTSRDVLPSAPSSQVSLPADKKNKHNIHDTSSCQWHQGSQIQNYTPSSSRPNLPAIATALSDSTSGSTVNAEAALPALEQQGPRSQSNPVSKVLKYIQLPNHAVSTREVSGTYQITFIKSLTHIVRFFMNWMIFSLHPSPQSQRGRLCAQSRL
jgi:hypothetical protein